MVSNCLCNRELTVYNTVLHSGADETVESFYFILFLNSKLQVVKYLIKVQPDGDKPLSTSFFLILFIEWKMNNLILPKMSFTLKPTSIIKKKKKITYALHAPPFNLNPDLTSLRVNVTDNVNNKVMMYTMRFWCILSFCKCYTAESYLCLVFGKSWPWLPRLCFS